MTALSDLGGRREFFGPIMREVDEPVFHSRADARVFGIAGFVMALFGRNLDAFRFAMEQLPRDVYLASYYRRMLGGCERLLVQAGYLRPGEVEARLGATEGRPRRRSRLNWRMAATSRLWRWGLRPRLPPWLCTHVLPRVFGAARPARHRPRFAVGDRIRVRGWQAQGHTRQPGYVTGKQGVVTAHLGATLFPDAHAVGHRSRPEHLYSVAFDGQELWGEAAEPETEVRVDLYEPYLEVA